VAELHPFLDQTAACTCHLFFFHRRRLKQRLLQLTVEHLDEAMRVAMIVDATALTFTPTQSYQVELAVASVDQVSGVPSNILITRFMLQSASHAAEANN